MKFIAQITGFGFSSPVLLGLLSNVLAFCVIAYIFHIISSDFASPQAIRMPHHLDRHAASLHLNPLQCLSLNEVAPHPDSCGLKQALGHQVVQIFWPAGVRLKVEREVFGIRHPICRAALPQYSSRHRLARHSRSASMRSILDGLRQHRPRLIVEILPKVVLGGRAAFKRPSGRSDVPPRFRL